MYESDTINFTWVYISPRVESRGDRLGRSLT